MSSEISVWYTQTSRQQGFREEKARVSGRRERERERGGREGECMTGRRGEWNGMDETGLLPGEKDVQSGRVTKQSSRVVTEG